jgi:hypothetical protein
MLPRPRSARITARILSHRSQSRTKSVRISSNDPSGSGFPSSKHLRQRGRHLIKLDQNLCGRDHLSFSEDGVVVASGLLDQLALIRGDSSFVHSPQEVHELGSVAPEGGVDLHVAAASAVQLSYLLLTVPLSFDRLLLTLKLFRLDASQEPLRQDGSSKRACDANQCSR